MMSLDGILDLFIGILMGSLLIGTLPLVIIGFREGKLIKILIAAAAVCAIFLLCAILAEIAVHFFHR